MKKTMLVLCLLGMLGSFGCTSAKAYVKKRDKDGNTVESYVSVFGYGDKASKVAAEGMFVDGSDEDLGAGVKSAQASQESTGVAEAFKGLGGLIGEAVRAYTTINSLPSPQPTPQPAPQPAQARVQLYDANGNLCNEDGSPCSPNDIPPGTRN